MKIKKSNKVAQKIAKTKLIEIKDLPLISVIVVTYNDAKHVCRAINSILKQGLKNIEIILVDDASTDNTKEILLNKYKNNSRVKLFFQNKNNRQGYQRNFGILQSSGKYIFFLDSDDWISKKTLIHLCSIAEEHKLEVVGCGANSITEDGDVSFYHGEDMYCSGGLVALNLFADYKIGSIVWNKLYLRSFLISNEIFFTEKYIHEDVIFSRDVIFKCKHYASISEPYYNYLLRESSTIRAKQNRLYIQSYINLYKNFCDFFEVNKINGQRIKYKLLNSHCFNNIYPNLLRYSFSRSRNEWKKDLFVACTNETGKYGHAIADFIYSIIPAKPTTNKRKPKNVNGNIELTRKEMNLIQSSRKIKHILIPSGSLRSKIFKNIKIFLFKITVLSK